MCRIYKVYSRLVFNLFVIVALFWNSFNAGANVPVNCTHNQILYPAIHSKVLVKKMKIYLKVSLLHCIFSYYRGFKV